MSAHATKRDSNNFISLILSKIELARNFKQRIALTITCKRILGHITLKFYLRKRHKKLYLFIRPTDNFGNIQQRHKFYLDIKRLLPDVTIESIKGHYTGFTIDIFEHYETVIQMLKLISLLSRPKDFYKKETKVFISYYNYQESSVTPIHIRFTHTELKQLECSDLLNTLYTQVKEFEIKNNKHS